MPTTRHRMPLHPKIRNGPASRLLSPSRPVTQSTSTILYSYAFAQMIGTVRV